MKTELPFSDLPEGTVTFLFTDIEASTLLLQQLGADRYGQVLADQRRILREIFAKWNGQEVDTQGDAFFVAFPRATQAVSAAVEIQRALNEHQWPKGVEVRVRMGLHTGEPLKAEEGYVGMDVHRAARIAHVGHGGQVLLSETTTTLVMDELPDGVRLLDLGRHLLKDMRRPEHIRQLIIKGLPSEFPSLKSLERLPPAELREPRQVGECPYRGLAAFRESDASFFYGRETFTDRLTEAVRTQPMVAVIVGSSGSGKSSAVFAGLLPRLRTEADWLVIDFRPGSRPFQAGATALLPLLEPELGETESLVEIRRLADALNTGELSLFDVLERALVKDNQTRRLLLVIDQFEELYSLCPDEKLRRRFLDNLLEIVETAGERLEPSMVLLLTMRADFMGQALAYRRFTDALQETSLLMGPMNREELRTAVEKPAEIQGAAFEPGLVERILDDVGEEPGNLPLLEFALTLLWERQNDGWLTHGDYEALGCVEGALAHYADEDYAKLDESDREAAHLIFVQLVRPGVGTEDTRRMATREELGEANWGLIQYLADKRLVVTGRDASSGDETVEVVHEALIQEWDRLRQWMSVDRDFRTWQERLRASLLGWQSSQRDEGALLRGAPLAQAEEWLDRRRGEIGAAEQEYIQVSVAFQEKRQAQRERRRNLIISGLVAGLVVALLLSIFAFDQRRAAEQNAALANRNAAAATVAQGEAVFHAATAQAASTQAIAGQATAQANANALATARANAESKVRIATSRDLADEVIENLDVDPQLSLLLALHAVGQTRNLDGMVLPEAWSALYPAIQASSRLVFSFPAEDQYLLSVSYSPDGMRLVTYGRMQSGRSRYSSDSHTRVWDSMTGELLYSPEGHLASDFWPRARGLATFNRIGRSTLEVTFWDDLTGELSSTLQLDLPMDVDISDFSGFYRPSLSDEYRYIEYVNLNSAGTRVAVTIVTNQGYGETMVWDLESREKIFSERSGTYRWGTEMLDRLLADIPSDFSPSGTYLVTGGADGIARMWNLDSGEQYYQLIHGEQDYVEAMAFSPDGTLLATGSGNPEDEGEPIVVRIWEVNSGQIIAKLIGHSDFVNDLTFSLDGSLLATTSYDRSIKIWDVGASSKAGVGLAVTTLANLSEVVYDITISPDGNHLAGVGPDGIVRVWQIAPAGQEGLLSYFHEPAPDAASRVSISLSPNGDRMAVADASLSPTVWNTESGEPLFKLIGHTGRVEQVEYSPDGQRIATASYDGTVKIWHADDGELELTLEDCVDCDLSFHPDGRRIVINTRQGSTKVFDILDLLEDLTEDSTTISFNREGFFYTFDTYYSLYGDYIKYDIEYSPDGELFARSSGHEVKFLDAESGEGTRFLISLYFSDITRDFLVDSFTYSPDGGHLVTNSKDGPIVLWNIQNGELIRTFSGPAESALCFAFSPDGTRLASGATDGTTTVWEVETGQELFAFSGHTDAVTDVAFSPDGKRLYTASLDGTVREYLMDIEELMDVARDQLTRDLTAEECLEYLHTDECPPIP